MSSGETTMVAPIQYGVWDKLFRTIAFKLLAHLEYGQLTIKEKGTFIDTFGHADKELSAEIDVKDSSFYRRLVTGGSIGAAELYIDKHWDTPDLTAVIRVFARNLPALDKLETRLAWLTFPFNKYQHWSNRNHKGPAKKNISAHYDLGNELYTRFLDEAMQYSSALFLDAADSLEQAQCNKMKRLCDSLALKPDDHLLEIGTGWGGLAVYAAKHYGCRVTTTTISEEQFQYAKEQVEAAGLSDKIELLKRDYRDLKGQYDKLVSVEMIEAVGKEYLPTFFRTCNKLLKEDGKMSLQAITIADQRAASYARSVDFIQKHIFPGGFLPSLSQMTQLFTRYTDLVVRDVHDFGLSYAKTLRQWEERFNSHQKELEELGYDERFSRLWNYYFSYCEGGFLEQRVSVVQVTASKAQAY
ncbi:SAM-dependent methyltransferase [Idiomarina abyssalis]|uniref:SAM-dependent methyltransferase n=1 Tax=Idiomarina abyssalis TaxID=86102 RepID=UPI0006C85419|nr:cyclopropane-fatty-acyl-phospholipid synthase family protein [Idiomarina abyssalis]KPD22546.1 cyclopropane-fatty-acyl-phospholipid synthase [Idiomarina abyssalis]SFT42896.1 cyclopropane-fatty-acyl-phospholipid synthase [Idiomarina abyssalis]